MKRKKSIKKKHKNYLSKGYFYYLSRQKMVSAVTILLCILHVLSLANGDCDIGTFTRSPCDPLNPIPDKLTCEKKLACIFIYIKTKLLTLTKRLEKLFFVVFI